MTGIGVTMHVGFRLGRRLHRLADGIRDLDSAQWGIPARDGLGERENVWFDAPMFECKPLARTTKTCYDLIRNEKHAVLVTNAAHEREIIARRDDHTANAHDGFSNERRDR